MNTLYIELARDLVADLAERTGIINLAINKDGEAVMALGEKEIYLRADERLPLIHVTAQLMELPEDSPELERTLEALLEANLFADKLADGWFAYSRELEQVFLNGRIELLSLPDDRLDEPLGNFLQVYDAWLGALGRDNA